MNKFSIQKMKKWGTAMAICVAFLAIRPAKGQSAQSDSTLTNATLENVVHYAIDHQPLVQQSIIDEETTQEQIKGKLADWYPQITALYTYQRNIQLQTNVISSKDAAGNPTQIITKFGKYNTSAPQIYATQNIFNRDVLLASKSKGDVRARASQMTTSTKIDVAVGATKAFYDVLSTVQQIKLGQGDLVRLKQSLKNAQDQYSAGIADKTDYKRATIALSNTQATLKSNQELLKYKLENLKAIMGYPVEKDLDIKFDTLQMENEIDLDTTQTLNYADRIEYKLLDTQWKLQHANLQYAKWSFLPTVQAYGYWISNYFNDSFSELYNTRYPNTYAGLNVSIPLFQGGKRTANIHQQNWGLKRIDQDIYKLKSTINSQYAQAMAAYKSNLITYLTLKENVELAKEVYDVIQLQYRTGIKTYLEVISAETDLRNTRVNYFNALYNVLSSKLDVQKSLGQIIY